MRKIEWTPDGVDSLNEIIEYYADRAGKNVAVAIYDKIIKKLSCWSWKKQQPNKHKS